MCLKYLLCDINACGYPTNYPSDKCFELSVSRNKLWWMVWSTSGHTDISATQVPPALRAWLGCSSFWWYPTGWATFRAWQSPRPFCVFLRVQQHLLLNLSIWESSHTVEFDLALVRISPLFQSADRQPQLTKSLVPYSTNLANKTGNYLITIRLLGRHKGKINKPLSSPG